MLIGVSLIVLLLLLTGFGIEICDVLNMKERGYHAPIGMVFFLACLQLLYYPVQLAHASFYILLGETCIVLAYMLYCFVKHLKRIKEELWKKNTLWIGLSFVCMFLVFRLCYIDLERSDSVMYLNYISQNINNPHINLFHLYNGKIGAEWDGLYVFQGYYHFVSCWVWLLNVPSRIGIGTRIETLKASVWSMVLLYQVISSMFFVGMIDRLCDKKPLNWILKVFTLFYLNFYYWRLVFGYYGNTWRSLLIAMLMFVIYQWLKGDYGKEVLVLIPAINFAGIAASSSYLFISFAVLSILAAFLFLKKQEDALYNMSIFVLPLCVYASVMIMRMSRVGYALALIFLLYYTTCKTKVTKTIIQSINTFVCKHAKIIFYWLIPGFCVFFALYIHVFHMEFLYGYAYYFNDHQTYDMVKDYFFVYSTWYDNLVNVVRWVGVVLLIRHAKTMEEDYIKVTCILMLVVFMNPLCTPTIAYFIASNVFYRAWEVLFNPFTECLMIIVVYQLFDQRMWRVCVSLMLGIPLVVSTVNSFSYDIHSSYGLYLKLGQEVNPYSKLEPSEEDAIVKLRYFLEQEDYDHQPVILSQAEGTRVYIPNAYLLVTPRDLYYKHTRLNEDLYQIARRHHPWDEDVADYTKTEALMKEFGVEYVAVRYWENPEFDASLDPISSVVYDNGVFKIRKLK